MPEIVRGTRVEKINGLIPALKEISLVWRRDGNLNK